MTLPPSTGLATNQPVNPLSGPMPWNVPEFSVVPRTHPASGFDSDGVEALFFDGPPWKGQPTRVFAYIGIPEHEPGVRVPGIVLVHGGGHTAFAYWVQLWTSRGYAAIALDTGGSTPNPATNFPVRDPLGGPPGWGGFDQLDEPTADQWTYHAIANVLLAHSLLAARPEVDGSRIGLTGVSWGGYLACIAAGVDPRFKFAVPVYGCGFLGEDSFWLPQFAEMGPAKAARWLGLWDPSRYVGRARMPFLWVTGTNDFAYPLNSLQKTYRLLPAGQNSICMAVRMAHGHGGPSEKPPEILAFADSLLNGGAPLARVLEAHREANNVSVKYEASHPIVRAELNFTRDSGPWVGRHWDTIPADLDAPNSAAVATLPAGTTVYYFNLIDDRDLVVSSQHIELSVDN